MSASEKLRALDVNKWPWWQITAVVEAAERAPVSLRQGQRAMNELVWTHADITVERDLSAALAALDGALGA